MYPPAIRNRAIELRKVGYSIKEIERELHIARSTSSLWLKNIEISEEGKKRLERRKQIGIKILMRVGRHRSICLKRLKTKIHLNGYRTVRKIPSCIANEKLVCSLLFWAEGGKNLSSLRFTNSDPSMIQLFLSLLRKCFKIDESKLRIILHLHEYHSETEMKEFWSDITKISTRNFHKSYLKPHTGKRKKEGYKGCVALYYYDYRVAHELNAIYNAYTQTLIGNIGT